MDGVLHVIEQLGQAHKHALAVIAEQEDEIRRLRQELAEQAHPTRT